MDDSPQCSLVRANGPSVVDCWVRAATAHAPALTAIALPPGCERITTALAKRWRQRENGFPTSVTNRPANRVFERLAATGARRRKDDGEERVKNRSRAASRIQ
jgi:hypothetical protein